MGKTNLFLLLPESSAPSNQWMKLNDDFLEPESLKHFSCRL